MRLFCAILIALPLAAWQTGDKPAEPAAKKDPAAPAAAEQASPAPDTEKQLEGSVTLGYRWTGNGGNREVYRSIVNLGEGVRLVDMDLHFLGGGKLFDRLDVRANSWGGDPYNNAFLDVRKQGVYRLNADYRNIAYFNFLPSFANPQFDNRLSSSQRTYDTWHRIANVDLELRPGSRVIPYLSYSHSSDNGRGVLNFVSNQNEYPVADDIRDSTENYRGGVRIELARMHATIEQGGLTFKDDLRASTADRNLGNRTTPYFGQTLLLTALNQAYGVRGDSVYTRLAFTASPTSWADVRGQFLYSRPETNVRYFQADNGLFVAPNGVGFYTGQFDLSTGSATLPRSSGDFGFEIRPASRVRVTGSWMTNRFHVTSAALLAQQFAGATGGAPSQLQVVSAEAPTYSYSQEQVDVFFELSRKFTVRIGERYVWGDSTVTAYLDAPYVEEHAKLRQPVGLVGLILKPSTKLTANLDAELGASNRSYFRTSLYNYQRVRGRVKYQVTPSVELAFSVSALLNQNPSPPTNYDFRYLTQTLQFAWRPASGKHMTLWGEYTRSALRSDLSYFMPQTLSLSENLYRENAHTGSAILDLNLPAVAGQVPVFSLGGAFFKASGSRPTNFYQPVGKLSVPVARHAQVFAEWRYWGYAEAFYQVEGFRSHQLMMGLKLSR